MHALLPIISFLCAIVLLYTAWWSYKNRKDVFKSWLLIGLAMLLYSIANLFYFIFEDVMMVISSPSIADVFYLAMYPLLITGLLLFFKRPINIRFKSLLDTAIVMISAFFIVWFPLIWPIVEPSQPDALSMIFSLFYIFLDLTILFIVLALIFNRNKKIFDLPIALVSLALFFQIFGDIIYAYYVVVPTLFSGWLFNVLYVYNTLFITLAAISFLKNVQLDLGYLKSFYGTSKIQKDLISYLPLILVLFTYGLLIITTPDEALIWGVGIVVVMVILRQIVSLNEIKRNKELISEKKEQLSFITTNMVDLITESDEKGILKYISPSCEQVLGYSPDDLMGKSFHNLIHPDDLPEISINLEKSVASQGSVRLKYRIKNAKGKYIFLETIGKPFFDDKSVKGFIYSSRDITVQIKSAQFVKNSLKEKETLLREIHHRVNNNLQIIISLLNLESRKVVAEEDHELFVESQNRVRSMSMIHEKLYQSDNLSSINFSDYLKTLLSTLIYENSKNMTKFDLEVDIDEEIDLNIETSVPCGLIINEIVSNSLKHAFPSGVSGKITVKMHKSDEEYDLIVGDDGIGFREKFDLENETLGLTLINSLVDQLDGDIELLEGEGTFYKIKFQELKYKERL
jgi:PAS domain S-box-containing protein